MSLFYFHVDIMYRFFFSPPKLSENLSHDKVDRLPSRLHSMKSKHVYRRDSIFDAFRKRTSIFVTTTTTKKEKEILWSIDEKGGEKKKKSEKSFYLNGTFKLYVLCEYESRTYVKYTHTHTTPHMKDTTEYSIDE